MVVGGKFSTISRKRKAWHYPHILTPTKVLLNCKVGHLFNYLILEVIFARSVITSSPTSTGNITKEYNSPAVTTPGSTFKH